jgi:hypothetical protein
VKSIAEIEAEALKCGITVEQLREAAQKFAELPKEQRENAEMMIRAAKVRELPLGVEGYKHFHWCLHRNELPPYAELDWIPSFAAEEWTILECFRGSWKSSLLSLDYNLYALGKEPWTSSLIVMANDDAANGVSSQMSTVIEYFSGWKACFPNIVPDKDRGMLITRSGWRCVREITCETRHSRGRALGVRT